MDIITYKDAAALLRMPLGTLYSMVARMQIPHVRLGPRTVRFRRAELERWLREREVAEAR